MLLRRYKNVTVEKEKNAGVKENTPDSKVKVVSKSKEKDSK